MTAPETYCVKATDTQAESRPPWIAPAVKRLHASDAEDGIDPNIADGLLTYS